MSMATDPAEFVVHRWLTGKMKQEGHGWRVWKENGIDSWVLIKASLLFTVEKSFFSWKFCNITYRFWRSLFELWIRDRNVCLTASIFLKDEWMSPVGNGWHLAYNYSDLCWLLLMEINWYIFKLF